MNDDVGTRILRGLSPGQKLRAAERLYWSAWQLKTAAVKARHPTWTSEQVKDAVRQFFLHGRS